jgi:hypothetical protein
MRKVAFLRGAVLLSVAVSPAFVLAQFQQPTNDELKMTADPKAPGAAAVYLNISETANDPMHYESVYVRIKVLTEKGKDLAKVEVPFVKGDRKVTDIKGRTIHSDGTVIPLTVKPEDLLAEKRGDLQFQQKVFTLPSVDVGSILEYAYTLRYDDNEFSSPQWEIQRPYFVHSAHYQFTPFKAFMPRGSADTSTSMYLVDERGRVVNTLAWWNRLPTGVTMKTSVNGSYTVDVTDIPPIPDEEHMPPIDSLLYRVFFYYMAASTPGEFWISEAKFWSKDVDKFAEPSKAIKDAVAGLVTPSDADLDKAKKLYAAVQALDNTDYSRKKSASEMKHLKIKEAKHAEDTWAQKSGSSEDIAMLYLAMLRAAGLTAYATKIVDRDDGVFDPSYMSLRQLDTTLVVLSTSGGLIVLDPGEKMCPFQTVNWRHSEARGLAQSAQGLSISTTPSQRYKDNEITRVADINVDPHGEIKADFNIIMTGQAALRWRQEALRVDTDELKKRFDDDLQRIVPEGVEAHVDHFLGIDDPNVKLIANVKAHGTLGTATSKRLLLPGLFFATHQHQPFVDEEKRQEPVDMRFADRVNNQVTYHLPQGMTVEGTPPEANVSWTGHSVFAVKVKSDDAGQVMVSDALASAFTVAKPEEYQDLRGFYQKVAAAAQGQLVLTTSPVAAATAPAGAALAPAAKSN